MRLYSPCSSAQFEAVFIYSINSLIICLQVRSLRYLHFLGINRLSKYHGPFSRPVFDFRRRDCRYFYGCSLSYSVGAWFCALLSLDVLKLDLEDGCFGRLPYPPRFSAIGLYMWFRLTARNGFFAYDTALFRTCL